MSRSSEDPKNRAEIEVVCTTLGLEKEKGIVISDAGKTPGELGLNMSKAKNSILFQNGELKEEESGEFVTKKKFDYEKVKNKKEERLGNAKRMHQNPNADKFIAEDREY